MKISDLPAPHDGLAPLAPSDTSCRMVVERIDPKRDERWGVTSVEKPTLAEGIEAVGEYLKRRHDRKWWIWCTGWMEFTCVHYDGQKLEGEYLVVRLEAATVASN